LHHYRTPTEARQAEPGPSILWVLVTRFAIALGSCLVLVFPNFAWRIWRSMPVLLIWAAPAVIAVGVTGYYLESFANLIDAALGLGMRTERPLDRRRKFKVIEGGKATPRKPRCAG
jgi:hypothetical protein